MSALLILLSLCSYPEVRPSCSASSVLQTALKGANRSTRRKLCVPRWDEVSPIYTQRIHGAMKWACARQKTVPGIRHLECRGRPRSAPATSSPRAAIFRRAWLGLVPWQIWTGDRANLQARQSIPGRPTRAGGSGGANQAAELGVPRAQTVSCQDAMHRNLLAIALTNKLASVA
jgi:hypothetical protein